MALLLFPAVSTPAVASGRPALSEFHVHTEVRLAARLAWSLGNKTNLLGGEGEVEKKRHLASKLPLGQQVHFQASSTAV